MKCSLAYGRGTLDVELPERHVVKVLGYKTAKPIANPVKEVRRLLHTPTDAEPLEVLASGKESACIVISDITRPVPNKVILPPILETLEKAGVPRSGILILVGTGLHRASTKEEKLEMLGEDIVQNYRIIDHNAQRRHEHEFLGETSGGVPMWIDRRYLEADVKILTGLIEPHFMAGWSGGRKSICPAITATETIGAWHKPRFLEHENAKFGVLDGNPVHAEQLEIARKVGCDFIVNVVIDSNRKILKVVAGDMEAAHLEGVAFARTCVVDTVPEPVDIVVTSGAGYPLDKTWYQSIKGVVAAIDILKPGGTIILSASCDEGLGSREFELIAEKFETIDAFMAAILADEFFVVNQWQLEELAKALRKGKVKVVSDGLLPEEFQRYYVSHVPSIEQAVDEALAEYGESATIAVLPDGPYVLAELGR